MQRPAALIIRRIRFEQPCTQDNWRRRPDRVTLKLYRGRPPASIRVAVMGVVAIVMVVAVAFVAIEQFEIDLVQTTPNRLS